jgi:hypothetical protein
MKTIDVKKLVTEVLATLPQPYSENIIDEVFFAIEQNDRFFRRYSECCSDLGRIKVNTAGANWVRKELGRTTLRESPAKLSKLIGTYSVLDIKAAPVIRKPAVKKVKTISAVAKKRLEVSARKSLSDYYMANKASLPAEIGLYREQIIALIKSGIPVAEAFEQAVDEEAVEFSD